MTERQRDVLVEQLTAASYDDPTRAELEALARQADVRLVDLSDAQTVALIDQLEAAIRDHDDPTLTES